PPAFTRRRAPRRQAREHPRRRTRAREAARLRPRRPRRRPQARPRRGRDHRLPQPGAGAGPDGRSRLGRLRAGGRGLPGHHRPSALHGRGRRGAEGPRRGRSTAAVRGQARPRAVRRPGERAHGQASCGPPHGARGGRGAEGGFPYDWPRDRPMSDRLVVVALALVAAVALIVALWGAVNRETGARSALLLLPDRYIDFTGRTDPVPFPQGSAVLIITAVGAAAAAAGAAAPGKARYALWLAAAILLIGGTIWGLARFGDATQA